MTDMPVNFPTYGFSTQPGEQGELISYGDNQFLWLEHEDIRLPQSVLFSIYRMDVDGLAMTVGPTLLDMPVDPPFLFTATDLGEVHAIIDDHRRRADRLSFPHERIAEYLALRHANRLHGDVLDEHDIAFITRRDMPYAKKLLMIILA